MHQVVALVPGFRYDPNKVQWVGNKIHFIVWKNLKSGARWRSFHGGQDRQELARSRPEFIRDAVEAGSAGQGALLPRVLCSHVPIEAARSP